MLFAKEHPSNYISNILIMRSIVFIFNHKDRKKLNVVSITLIKIIFKIHTIELLPRLFEA